MTEPRISAVNGQKRPTFFTTTRHQYTLHNGEEVQICVQSFDPQETSLSPFSTALDPSNKSWILGVNGTLFINPGEDDTVRSTAGKFTGLLIKRELFPQVGDEFLRRMMSVNSFTRQQAQQLFDAQGRLKSKFKGRGIWGSENDSSWIFELGTTEIAPEYRREGVGRKMIECVREEVLTWAREAQRDVLMVLMLGATKSAIDEHKVSQPACSAAELQQVSSTARQTAKHFWRSLGFRRLSARSNWFGWTRSVAGPRDHPFSVDGEWESEDEMVKFESHDDDTAPDVAEKWACYHDDYTSS
ncbi:hypothetical protein N0V93_008127 [Gnomoniopsis smithogilvyi]|uniref:N-acetyltransferase domain-containing protein n=1 Tax=Gnomoniopsis smithogilvyi TaxID=1191159 RepID=A0A9W8YLE2_9PEZI|nr:hypothetical protein N0V93_008127 [Gnomoniopsis smithogilvyi]